MMKDTEEKQFKSMISCGRHLIKTYGFMRLFRGDCNSNDSHTKDNHAMTLNQSFNLLIQVVLEIFYDFGHQVSRLL